MLDFLKRWAKNFTVTLFVLGAMAISFAGLALFIGIPTVVVALIITAPLSFAMNVEAAVIIGLAIGAFAPLSLGEAVGLEKIFGALGDFFDMASDTAKSFFT